MLSKTLNAPRPLQVEAEDTPDGPSPRRVLWRGRWRHVLGVDDVWHVDDEWWRAEISRRYFVVRLEGELRVQLFWDRIGDGWWWQRG